MQYLSVNDYLKNKYGHKIYKLALNGGRTCPNRDGTCGEGGCIFCGEGSGTFASDSIDEAIEKLSKKNTGDKYIAYFQSFTSTYKMDDDIKQRMIDAAGDDRIEIVSIATRPDCLEDEVMEFLAQLSKEKPLWVELGLQTIHPESARFINRGYELSVFDEAVTKLRSIKAEVIVHLILGLPGESWEDMLKSAKYLNDKDVQGVKLQLLHILEGTKLGEMFKQDEIYPLTLDEYADLIVECLKALREDIVIHRITGDAPKKFLIEPKWSGDKKKVLNTLKKKIEEA